MHRGYREVPYDALLHSKRVPCPSHESAMRHPDSYNLFEDPERYAVPAQQWRKLVRSSRELSCLLSNE